MAHFSLVRVPLNGSKFERDRFDRPEGLPGLLWRLTVAHFSLVRVPLNGSKI